MEQLYRHVLPLVQSSILLKVELGDTRRPSDARRPNHVALPYFVPWLPRDESTKLSSKRFSVCLEMSSNSGGSASPRARYRGTASKGRASSVRYRDIPYSIEGAPTGSMSTSLGNAYSLLPPGEI